MSFAQPWLLLLLAALPSLLLLAAATPLLLLVAHLGFLGTVTLGRVALLLVLLRLRGALHRLRRLLHPPLGLVDTLRAGFSFLLLEPLLQLLHFLGQVLRPLSHFLRGTLCLGAIGSFVGTRQ